MSEGETHWEIANSEDEIRSLAALKRVEWVNISPRGSKRLGFLEAILKIVAGNRIDGDILEIRNYIFLEPARYYIKYIEIAEYFIRESGNNA